MELKDFEKAQQLRSDIDLAIGRTMNYYAGELEKLRARKRSGRRSASQLENQIDRMTEVFYEDVLEATAKFITNRERQFNDI